MKLHSLGTQCNATLRAQKSLNPFNIVPGMILDATRSNSAVKFGRILDVASIEEHLTKIKFSNDYFKKYVYGTVSPHPMIYKTACPKPPLFIMKKVRTDLEQSSPWYKLGRKGTKAVITRVQ